MALINEGRVAVITGAGNGIGRQHALAFAQSGAKVVVNDLGGARDGTGGGDGPAASVVAEIQAAGGEAVANTDNVATFEGARRLIDQALDTFGDLHILVNNAGILRDKMMVNMSEADWDAVIAVHLKGTFGPTHHAANHWRRQAKDGMAVDASVINTTSSSGLFGNPGQSNYGAAKAGIAAFTIITATELSRIGVRVNAIAPSALTRMTEDLGDAMKEFAEAHGGLEIGPQAISPVVVYLGSPLSAPTTGRVFSTVGGRVTVLEGWSNGPYVETDGVWDPTALADVLPAAIARAAGNADTSGNRP